MGSWAIHIAGHGIHDNNDPNDADAILHETVAQLLKAGHVVDRAEFISGGGRVVAENGHGADRSF